jgi:hypothetical protein
MFDLRTECDMLILSDEQVITDFDCGHADFNEFFNCDALAYKHQMGEILF